MTPVAAVSEEYLAEAAGADLLRECRGHQYVVGLFTDPISGQRQCLVEYCEAGLLARPESVELLLDEVGREFPGADPVLLRTPAGVRMPESWIRSITYVRHEAAPVPAAPPPTGIEVVPSGPEHDPFVLDWLSRALHDGYLDQQWSVAWEPVREAAAEILASADRRGFVALVDGVPVGHVTLRWQGLDEVTRESQIELVDMMVEPGSDRAASGALVAAAVLAAARDGRPLVGNVVHPVAEPDRGRRILDGLLGRGWLVDHTMWRAVPGRQVR